MDIPESMRDELQEWNGGKGIDLESWIGCEGNFSLSIGYCTVFWPEFVELDGYIIRQGFTVESLRGFESQPGSSRKSVEWVMNHLHLVDIHTAVAEDASKDKLIVLGKTLKQIYEAKLKWQFPDRPCIVELCIPENEDELWEYQISFWQECHEPNQA